VDPWSIVALSAIFPLPNRNADNKSSSVNYTRLHAGIVPHSQADARRGVLRHGRPGRRSTCSTPNRVQTSAACSQSDGDLCPMPNRRPAAGILSDFRCGALAPPKVPDVLIRSCAISFRSARVFALSQRAAAISVIVFAASESSEIEPFAIATSAAAAGAPPFTD
jgi:hypothetical protein